ncbi:MAG TPA: cellulose-binding domain-containing protein, partial [Rugosimonospora sp.]|nr:cellulose-binding domain-containing protein [Rugosimonospora sp.]
TGRLSAPPLPLLVTAATPGRGRRSRRVLGLGLASLVLMGAGAAVDLLSMQVGAAGRPTSGGQDAAMMAPPAATTTPSPQSSADAVSGCAVTYHVRNMWSVGFTADVQLTNTGTAPVSTWTLTFAMPGDQRVLQGWNGVFGQAGRDVTVADAGYNAKLTPGSSTTLGFNGSYDQNNTAPAEFRLNGVPCSVNAQ